jgi:NADH-quinone oxidoreductase subunit N
MAVIHVPAIRYLAIMPVIVLLGGAILLLGLQSLVGRPMRLRLATIATVAISLTAFGLAWWQWADVESRGPYTTIAHAVVTDGFSVLITVLVTAAMALSAMVAEGYLAREGIEGGELHVLALVSASGAVLMAQANDLVIVFLGLEILSIALYVLTAYNHRRVESGEAGLKYFVLGGFSTAIFVYGIALTYGATGTTNLTQLADFLSRNVLIHDGLLLAGMSLLLVGFAFKVAAVPFHMWTPDVYQGAPSPITGFMAAVAKAGGFAAFLRVFVSSFGVLRTDWRPIVYVLAIVTLVVGAALAVVQRDIKRMLAYSSINHAGFVLLGLQAASAVGVSSALYYLFTYAFMVIGSFAVVTVIGRHGDRDHDIAAYRGLAHRQPLLALCFAVLLLAQAGVPFTTGFLAKFQVVVASVDGRSVPLAVVAMASAALAAFFYLRVTVLMYGPEPDVVAAPLPVGIGDPPLAVERRTRLNAALLLESVPVAVASPPAVAERAERLPVPLLAVVAIGVCVLVTVVLGVFPMPLVDFAHRATLLFLP